MKPIITTISLAALFANCVVAADNVEKRTVTIWSDGVRMVGDLYLPKDRSRMRNCRRLCFAPAPSARKKVRRNSSRRAS